MGSGIAQVAAMSGYQTLLYDVDPLMVKKGRAGIEKNLAALSEKGKITSSDLEAALRETAIEELTVVLVPAPVALRVDVDAILIVLDEHAGLGFDLIKR